MRILKGSRMPSVLVFLLLPGMRSHAQQLSFAAPVDISGGTVKGVSALDVGDFDQDGRMDVAVMEGGAHADGGATFAWFGQTPEKTWIRHEFGSLALFDDFIGSARCRDIDGDGDTDLVLTNDGHTTGPLKVFFFENPGKGKVTGNWPHHLIATIDGFHANDMRLADMDGDGKTDVIIRHKSPEAVQIIFQDARDNWTAKVVQTGQAGEGLAVGDIDRDGLPDITMTGHWLKAPKDPRRGEYRRLDIEAGYKTINKATKEEVGDINGDGRPDVVLSPAEAFPKYGGDNYDLAWYECPKDPVSAGAWKKHVILSNYNNAHCVKLADFDNDGDLDILTAVSWEEREVRILFNDDGHFNRSLQVVSGRGTYSGAVADMDNDGDLDLVGEDKYAKDARPWFYENLLK